MSEETNVETTEVQPEATQAPEGQNVNISVDQILAAVLNTVGTVTVNINDLVANYTTKSIKVDQLEDGSVKFELIDIPADAEVKNETEQASE